MLQFDSGIFLQILQDLEVLTGNLKVIWIQIGHWNQCIEDNFLVLMEVYRNKSISRWFAPSGIFGPIAV